MLLGKSVETKLFFWALFLSIFFYSFTSPWPNTFGLNELLVLIFLVASFWSGVILSVNLILINVLYWSVFLLLFTAGVLNNNFQDLIRDAVPYFYLGIPLFFMAFFERSRQLNEFSGQKDLCKWIRRLVFVVAGLGFVFSFRELFPFLLSYNFNLIDAVHHRLITHDQLYLFQAPSVLFSAVFFATYGISLIKRSKIKSLGFILIGFIAILSPFLGVLRGPVLLFLISLAFFIFIFSRYKLPIIILLVVLIFANMDLLSTVFKLLLLKQQAVGSNNKIVEFYEIIHHLKGQPLYNLFFGEGFGATYYSTGGGGVVRFAHSLPAYALIKGGIVSSALSICLILWILYKTLERMLFFYKVKNYFATSALLGFLSSFMINVLLEPGYKTLDFGLLLLVFICYVFFIKKDTSKQFESIYKKS